MAIKVIDIDGKYYYFITTFSESRVYKYSIPTYTMTITESGDDLEDIQQEIHILAEIQSRWVTRFYGCYLEGSKLHIVMEYCSGGSILDLVRFQCIAKVNPHVF